MKYENIVVNSCHSIPASMPKGSACNLMAPKIVISASIPPYTCPDKRIVGGMVGMEKEDPIIIIINYSLNFWDNLNI